MGHVWVWLAELDPTQCIGGEESKIEDCQGWGYVPDLENVGHDGISVQDVLEKVCTLHGLYVA